MALPVLHPARARIERRASVAGRELPRELQLGWHPGRSEEWRLGGEAKVDEDLAHDQTVGEQPKPWDATKGASFASWSYWWLRDAVQQEVRRTRSTIRVPRRATSPAPKVTSLDAPRGDDGATFGALIVDEDSATPADLAHRADLRERVAEALGALMPSDALVVEMHFGINGAGHPHTYAEIGARLGVCTQRARQIEQRALGLLRDALASFAE